MKTIRHAIADCGVVEDPHDRRPARFGLFDQLDDGGAVFGIQRGGRFIEQ